MIRRFAVALTAFLLLTLTASASISTPQVSSLASHGIRAGAATKKNEKPLTKQTKTVVPKPSNTATSTREQSIFNLVKSIVGAGVLGLPAGIAAYGNAPAAVVPAVVLIALIGGMSGYCFSLIGRVCAYTQSTTYREAWSKAVSPSTSWMPATACLLVTACSCLSYSMILSDTIPQLMSAIGMTLSRTQALLGVTSLVLLPLCLLRSMSKLAPFSLVGIFGMLYTVVAMGIRYFGGAYQPGSALLQNVPAQPFFGTKSSIWNPNAFLLISMLSTAYMAHYNAPKFYYELQDTTLPKYYSVVSISFCISILIFVAVASLGFLTFGEACSGLVLNNYATQDGLMSVSRIAVAISIICS